VKPAFLYKIFVLASMGAISTLVAAQTDQGAIRQDRDVSPSGVHLIARTTQAIAYNRGSTTELDMKGTDLLPELSGKAKVISKRGLTDVHVDVDHLRPASSLDMAYLTYVLWAVSPEGQAKNIGELVEHDGKASLHTSTDLQSFALVITAEPDFAVNQPSELVVGENSVRATTEGRAEAVDVHYQVFPRSTYVSHVAPVREDVYGNDKKVPLDLLQARNAVRIARDAQADQYASEILQRAETLLRQADDYYRRNQAKKAVESVAREATQTAEEARVTALHQEQQARLEHERQANQERAEQAQNAAVQAREQAQQAQEQAENAQQQAEAARQRAQAEAEHRRQVEEQRKLQAEQAQQAQLQAAQAQQQAEQAQQQAQTEAQQRAAAEEQQRQATAQAEQARHEAEQAQTRAQQLEAQQAQMREQLMTQLNQVLETKDTARGLIVSMPDVLFATGSANLKPTARERLAKVAGILIAYPDIHVEVDGYTDNTGSPLLNERLSQERAASVQSYLTQQGVPASSIAIHGFGEANPIASNDTASGRQQNRRVELVVSGRSIGRTQTVP
jgi:outer membrane protein OmpA-like peptidoglycan-associated protein